MSNGQSNPQSSRPQQSTMAAVPSKPSHKDPYEVLGLSHDATPLQIKVSYRKLALKYHPDRQPQSDCPSTPHAGGVTTEATNNLFVEIAAAYAILSDPDRKREYDHLYKFGAFDDSSASNADHSSPPDNMNYRYTENYSGGYYTNNTTKASTAQAGPMGTSQFFRSMSTVSHDSFFDDLIYSPNSKGRKTCFGTEPSSSAATSNTGTKSSGNNRPKKPGIGFAFAPLGKHLSIHIPSRNEIVMSMAKGKILCLLHLIVTTNDSVTKYSFKSQAKDCTISVHASPSAHKKLKATLT